MPTQWEDSIKNRNPKQLTVFATQKVSGAWRRAFDDALAEFNKLSQVNKLGVTMASPQGVAAPDPDGEGGAEVQFDVGKGNISITAFGQDISIQNFSGTSLHGHTQQVFRQFGNQPKRLRRAFIIVPETPMIEAALQIGPDNFKHILREVGPGVKLFIAVHELIHACGLSNSDHTVFGPGADVFVQQPQPSAGAFNKPEDDKLLLHLAAPQPNVFAPPLFLKKSTADKIRANWS